MSTLRRFLILLVTSALAAVSTRAAEDSFSLIPRYLKVASALAADDLPSARADAQVLATAATTLRRPDIGAAAQVVAKADSLATAREAFKTLSTPVIALAKQAKGYFILSCPMAKADWVQSTREVANPYFGKAMLTCGEVQAEPKN